MHSFFSREVGGATSQQKHAIRSSVGFGPFRAVWQTIVGRYHEQKTSFLAAKHLFCNTAEINLHNDQLAKKRNDNWILTFCVVGKTVKSVSTYQSNVVMTFFF